MTKILEGQPYLELRSLIICEAPAIEGQVTPRVLRTDA